MSDPFSLNDAPPSRLGGVPRAIPEPWLEGLNPEQRRAVETTEGPLLVLSGAGTGKTRVLTARLAHILARRSARPWEVMAVTFTNRAAREMRERVTAMIGPGAESLWLGTFHALAARILRRHADAVGLKSNFVILDADDQLRLLKQIMRERDIDPKRAPPTAVMATIQRLKDRGLPPEKAAPEDLAPLPKGLYAFYQGRLRDLNACDFGDLLLHCLTVFQAEPEVLGAYQRRFRYILVDEYQDTNVAQYLWLRLLAMEHRNICCVGDDDQSIYSWRGAEIGNILRFESDFPGAQVIRLERNYRSTARILKAASHLIAHNESRLGKTLQAAGSPGDGAPEAEPVTVRGLWDGEAEARAVIEEVEARHGRGEALSDMAVLVRAGFQTRAFEERLLTTGIPYRVIGGPRFYERQEIRDALAYLRLIATPEDDLAFERIVNVPKRGLGPATLQTLHKLRRATGRPLSVLAADLAGTEELKPKPRAALGALAEDFERWRALAAAMPVGRLTETVLEESGYLEMWRADSSPEAEGRLENLKELTSAVEEFDGLDAFLEHVSLVMENNERGEADRLTLMTLHAAKGLEFDTVFLPGWEEGVFPHIRALDEGGAKALEEERRLAYVGLTRARRKVHISFAANRMLYGKWQTAIPSRFIDELPADHVDVVAEPGLYGNATTQEGPSVGMAPLGMEWRHSGALSEGWERKPAPEAGFSAGERVFHEKFGPGTVRVVDGDKLHVAFDRAGLKKVMDGFVAKV